MEELKGLLFQKLNISTNNVKSILKQYNIQSIHLITGNNNNINKITTHNKSKLVLDFASFKNIIDFKFNDYSEVFINNSKFSLMKIRVNNMSKLVLNNSILPVNVDMNVDIYSNGFGVVEINNIKTNKLNLFSCNQSKIKINSIYLKGDFNVSSYDLSSINIESISKDTDLNNEQIVKWFLPQYEKATLNWQFDDNKKESLVNLLNLLDNKKIQLEHKNENTFLTE